MPVQVFTEQEIDLLKQGARKLVEDSVSLPTQLNMTKAQQKLANAALVDSQIAGTQLALDHLDATYDAIKSAESGRLNALLIVLSELKTKIQNLPE